MTQIDEGEKLRWRSEFYPSGTCVVKTREREPHLGVYGPRGVGDEKYEDGDDVNAVRIRYRMTDELAAWMNDGPRPAWLDDLRRVSETKLVGLDGSMVLALGPFYDANPPALQWKECDDVESRDARARLIDRVSRGEQS
jgi:hypothetical protein